MGYLRKPATPKPKLKPLGLRDFHNKRNRILIWHDKGGLGDVLMQRMLFEDFKAICPDAEFIFACLPEYMDAVKDHPYISEVIDSRTVNVNEFINHYNTCVTIADRYENLYAPFCLEHRSDIWAKYCGVDLQRHDMCFRLDPESVAACRKRIRHLVGRTGPIAVFCPVSKMLVKTLLPWQMEVIKDKVQKEEVNIVALHNKEIPELTRMDVPGVYQATIQEWMFYIAAADYVISVDTAAFHMAGGLKKPLMGIFTFADGKAYGKHFDFILVQKHRDIKYQGKSDWDCGPCFTFANCPKCGKFQKPCLTELTADELKNGIAAMFSRWPWCKNKESILSSDIIHQQSTVNRERNIVELPIHGVKNSVFSPSVCFQYRHDERNCPND